MSLRDLGGFRWCVECKPRAGRRLIVVLPSRDDNATKSERRTTIPGTTDERFDGEDVSQAMG